MDYRDLTKEDIEQYEEEINKYMQYRNAMKWSAVGSFGGAITFAILAFYFYTRQYQIYTISMYMIYFSIAAGIVLFILRSVLFNGRINRRRNLIKRYEKNQKENLNQ